MLYIGISAGIYDYSAVAKHAFGKPGEQIVDVAIILGALGSLVGYILVIGSILAQLLHSWGCSSVVCETDFVIVVAVGLFITPLCLFRHFGHLGERYFVCVLV